MFCTCLHVNRLSYWVLINIEAWVCGESIMPSTGAAKFLFPIVYVAVRTLTNQNLLICTSVF